MSCIVGQPPCSSDPNRSNTHTTRTCSLALVEQRFKRAIDSSLPQKREEDPPFLAIAYSGGLGSTVLLDLASRLLAPNGKDNGPRRRWKEIHVLHIEKQETNCSSTAQWTTNIGRYPEFRFKTLRLVDDFQTIFPPAASKPSFGSLSAESASLSLEQYLHGLPTGSARVATMRNLTRLAVEHHARVLGASHLLLGTSLSSISSSMISRICQGGGFTLASERGTHTNNLHVVAPLQDVMAKECAAWLKWNDLQTMGGIVPRPLASIESITRGKRFCRSVSSHYSFFYLDFMTSLERDYPSTVSTVSKTLAKIVPKGASSGECQICQRCTKFLFRGTSIDYYTDLYRRILIAGSTRLPLLRHDGARLPHRCMMDSAMSASPHKTVPIEAGESHRDPLANSSAVHDPLISLM